MKNVNSSSDGAANRCDVLIVEDDQIQCEEMASFLARSGLDVVMANNPAQALRVAATVPPRVALLDYNLPEMTGVELAEKMRALLPETPILMMSGRIDGLSEQTLAKLGITVFLNKPLPLGPLRQAVLKLVHSVPVDRKAQRPRASGWLAAGLGGTRS
jgi:DNA-binding NtrC family response regulator